MTISVELPEASATDELGLLTKKAEELRARFRPFGASMFPDDKRHMAKFRPGGEKIVLLVADAADSIEFEIPGTPTSSLREDLERARRLRPLLAEVEPLAQEIRDAIFRSESSCWGNATTYYSVLRDMARVIPKLALSLKDAVEFFAQGSRAEKASPTANANLEVEVKVSSTT